MHAQCSKSCSSLLFFFKEDINIEEAGAFLVKQIMLCDTSLSAEEHHWDRIKVNLTPTESQSQSLCCGRSLF